MRETNKNMNLATYRLQQRKELTYAESAAQVDYLHDLGMRALYLSPIYEAAAGSNHGYDGTDLKISEERGGKKEFETLQRKAGSTEPSMELLIDIVPNHMAAKTSNVYWADVLAEGRNSKFWSDKPGEYHLFDMRVDDGEKIQVPVLGGSFEDLLQKSELKISLCDKGEPCLCYWSNCFRLKKETIAQLKEKCGDNDLKSFLETMPKAAVKEIAAEQNFELVHWTTVKDHVSWRRFFDVTELVGVRVEDPHVYELTHALIKEVAADTSNFMGVRVDHVDGLVDPAAYLQRLKKDFGAIYIEKILGPGEELPASWPVQGTTGYEFISDLNGLMMDRKGSEKLENFFRSIQPRWKNFEECVTEGKQLALKILFPSELKRLVDLCVDSDADREQAALFWTGLTVGNSVYRTYYTDGVMSESDRSRVEKALLVARTHYGAAFIETERRFLPGVLNPSTDRQKQAVREWQQLSGPVMAKGLEDTAHYRYFPNAALNEVGCTPDLPEDGASTFYQQINRRAETHPNTLKATTTHDTKRNEDVRHRLYALSSIPEQWIEFFQKSVELNKGCRDTSGAPGQHTEYLLYQTLVGTWPLNGKIDDSYVARIQKYMEKAIKEAKLETSWIKPDETYEKGVSFFVGSVLKNNLFVEQMRTFADKLSRMGAFNSLAVQTLKILSPGLPDFYQGTEEWNFSLVDPDNRRPVDYAANRKLLYATRAFEKQNGREAVMRKLTEEWRNGGIKQWLTQNLLKIREDVLTPMGPLKMEPLIVTGKNAEQLVAYRLSSSEDGHDEGIAVIVPRNLDNETDALNVPVGEFEEIQIELDPSMKEAKYKDLLNGMSCSAEKIEKPAEMLKRFPISILSYKL